jgi:hypothetical protein
MKSFTLKRFLYFAHAIAVVAGAALAVFAAPIFGGWPDAILWTILGSEIGLVVAGYCYLPFWMLNLRRLKIPEEELADGEVVISWTPIGHFQSGRLLRSWVTVGGNLFLTNRVLEFRAHKGNFWVYTILIPLADIGRVIPCRLLRVFPGGLRIERFDGSSELFTLGVQADNASWARAIMSWAETTRTAAGN